MKNRSFTGALLLPALSALLLSPLVFSYAPEAETLQLTRLFPTERYLSVSFDDYLLASPLFDALESEGNLIIAYSGGVALLDGKTGAGLANIALPAPHGQSVETVATPLRFGATLFVLYQTVNNGLRHSHRLAAVDLRKREIDIRFVPLELSTKAQTVDGKTVVFNPSTAYSHAAVKHLPGNGSGYLYASFGNAGDTQPFHGWVFEIDIDAWRRVGAHEAVRSTLVTTAESECPVNYESGTQEMICGGVWNPAGPQVDWQRGEATLLVATGRQQLAANHCGNALSTQECRATEKPVLLLAREQHRLADASCSKAIQQQWQRAITLPPLSGQDLHWKMRLGWVIRQIQAWIAES